jgi:hypothetical protein
MQEFVDLYAMITKKTLRIRTETEEEKWLTIPINMHLTTAIHITLS